MPSLLELPWHACRCMSSLPYVSACRGAVTGRCLTVRQAQLGLTLEHMYGNIDALVEEGMQGMTRNNDRAAREIRGAVIMVIGLGALFIPLTLALLERL